MSSSVFQWPIIGHQLIQKYLQGCIRSDTMFHAYIFAGPEGVGKTTVARLFFQSLVCKLHRSTTPVLPCGDCKACRQMQRGVYPDLHWLSPSEDSNSLRLDHIRFLRDRLSKRAFLHGMTFVGIEKAHALTQEANNALLKLIEEPPSPLCLIFLTSAYTELPATLRSRTQVIFFHRVSQKLISDWLQKHNLTHSQASVIAQEAFGRPGFALQALENTEFREHLHAFVSDFLNILRAQKLVARLTLIEKNSFRTILAQKSRASFQKICEIWFFVLRDLLMMKFEQKQYLRFPTFVTDYKDFASKISHEQLLYMMQDIFSILKVMKENVAPQLLVEKFLMKYSAS